MNNMTAENALRRLPEAFWAAFAGELVSVFGIDIFQRENGPQTCMSIECVTGTCGWHASLKAVCKRLWVEWFYEWYDSMDWIESDEFDCDLVDELKAHVMDSDDKSKHAYYEWLVKESG